MKFKNVRMKVNQNFKGIGFLRVLPSNLLVTLDCAGRDHKNHLISQLDTFLYNDWMGRLQSNKTVDTAYYTEGLNDKLEKRSTAHYFFVAMVNRLMKQGFFAQYGIQVFRNKNKDKYTQIELVTKKGKKINFCYGKRYNVAMMDFIPFTYGLTA